jgi:two-component system, cell cycle sensor histidine kinase and response regulator CckA
MVAEQELAVQTSSSTGRSEPRRIRFLSAATVGAAGIASLLGVLCLGRLISPSAVGTALALIGLAALSATAAVVSYKTTVVLADRLDTLGRVLDLAPAAQLIVAPAGRLIYANNAFHQLFPRVAQAPLDRIERALCPDGESQRRLLQLRGQAAAGVRASEKILLGGLATGGAGPFKISVEPIAGWLGYSFWTVAEDIGATSDARNRLADLLDTAPTGFYSVDVAGRFQYVNQTLARWLGSSCSAIVTSGARLHDFLACPPPAGSPAFEPFAAHGARTRCGEIELKTTEGRVLTAWITQDVVGSGAELHTRSVVCESTFDSGLKAALRSTERFRRCFTNAPVGIALLDRFGRLEEANRAVGELFGSGPEILKGRELVGLLNEEDRDRIAAKLAAAADGRAVPEPVEVRPRRPSDRTMMLYLSRLDDTDISSSADPILEADRSTGLTLHFIDVTEQKNLEIQFAQSQKMQAVGQLAGGVAHDFNNLLTAMIGFCDLLLLRSPPGDPSFADIMQIKQNANRAANLVRQLLAFSRQQTLQPRVVNITDVLYELRHLLERLIGENIKLDVVHGRDLGLAKVDQGQLEQVIINLAVNARDAMPAGGTLSIRTANINQDQELWRGHELMPAGEYVLIEVADTGVGIPKENLARVFDPFFSTKELGSGTGLGLSTVYGIVKQTGGFIFVSSEPGRGATFQIYLPRYRAVDGMPSSRADVAEATIVRDLTGQGTILLVEDDDPVRIFSARALRNKGYEVVEAKSGEAALALIRGAEKDIDLVITDVVMPRMDGPRLVREVREIYPQMKVIFISGYTEDAFRQRLDSDGGIDFLPKPFSLKQLATKVREVIAAGP